jgi:hypothetical protein
VSARVHKFFRLGEIYARRLFRFDKPLIPGFALRSELTIPFYCYGTGKATSHHLARFQSIRVGLKVRSLLPCITDHAIIIL